MRNFFVCLLLGISLNLTAQERHLIDQQAYDALQDAVSTVEMMEAQSMAYKGWDQLMGVTMKALKAIVQPGTYDALENAQSLWVQFRDAEFELINRVYYAELQGTMWRPVAIAARTTIVRQRVEALMDIYLELSAQKDELYQLIQNTWVSRSEDPLPGMNIMGDLTVRYNEGRYKFRLGFYRMAEDCNGMPDAEGRTIISLYEFGSDTDAQCFYVNIKDGILELSEVNGDGIQTYSPKFR